MDHSPQCFIILSAIPSFPLWWLRAEASTYTNMQPCHKLYRYIYVNCLMVCWYPTDSTEYVNIWCRLLLLYYQLTVTLYCQRWGYSIGFDLNTVVYMDWEYRHYWVRECTNQTESSVRLLRAYHLPSLVVNERIMSYSKIAVHTICT